MRCSLALCAFSLFLFFSLPAFATADGPDFYAVHNVAVGDTLNVRSEPGMKAKVIGAIPHDAKQIRNLGEFDPPMVSDMVAPKWCKIKYKDLEGWVGCKFLMEDI